MKKRFFDICLSFLGLIVLAPLFITIAACIKWKTRSVFQAEKVFGKGFVLFSLYRFNTTFNPQTAEGIDIVDGKMAFLEKRLRNLHMERLPQLINVLKGEMSLIGPRPEQPSDVTLFQKDFETILQMRPGIMDLASITLKNPSAGPTTETEQDNNPSPPLPQRIKLAKEYVSHHTLSLDIKIFIASIVKFLLSLPFPFHKERQGRRPSVQEVLTKYRARTVFCLHTLAIATSSYLAFLLRFDGNIPATTVHTFITTLPLLILFRLTAIHLLGLHINLWRYVSIMDIVQVAVATGVSSGLFWTTLKVLNTTGYPESVLIFDGVLFAAILATLRCTKNIYKSVTHVTTGARKVLIIGAGNAGAMIARDLLQNPSYNRQPVAFIDDDPHKQNVKIHGIPVIGTSGTLHAAVKEARPEEIIIAIPSATPLQIKPILNQCRLLGLPIKMVPDLPALLSGKASISELRALDIEELIGRPEITIEKEAVAEKVRGKRILVTGAGGSIGSELCRQIAAFEPESLILYEQNENNLHHVLLGLKTQFPAVLSVGILADILNAKKVEQVFDLHKPQMVFHAAAYKHVPLMEDNPADAVRNNIIGTAKILLAAVRHNAEEFVLISTDKAVYPSGVMGATKRVAEMVVQYFAPKVATRLLTVRFGNVLESNGSVVPLFRNQIKRGGPITITDPEVKRYFITIQEAVQLVLQAAVLGKGGEIFVLDMGDPYKILDLARTMIILSGLTPDLDIPIQFVGLRPGEKLVEELFEKGEEINTTAHSKISIAKNGKVAYDIPPYLDRLVAAIEQDVPPNQIRALLKEALPTCSNL